MARVCVVTSLVSVVGLSEPVLNSRKEVSQWGTQHRLTDDFIDVLRQSPAEFGGKKNYQKKCISYKITVGR